MVKANHALSISALHETSGKCLVYEQDDWLEWLMLQVHGLRPAAAQKEHQQRLWQKRQLNEFFLIKTKCYFF